MTECPYCQDFKSPNLKCINSEHLQLLTDQYLASGGSIRKVGFSDKIDKIYLAGDPIPYHLHAKFYQQKRHNKKSLDKQI